MLLGIKLKANPTQNQKLILSQWMGCARLIWNAKCEEELYYSIFARKYYPIGTYAPIDQKASQFKDRLLTPWLYECPSQIIRNSAVNWYQTYKKFIKGECGKPRFKPKSDKGSIHLTRELFQFVIDDDGVMRLFIGSKTNNIGYLSFKTHKTFELPNSIYIKKASGKYTISFCYDKQDIENQLTNAEHLSYLQTKGEEYLNQNVIGIDRGVAIPAKASEQSFDFTKGQKKNNNKAELYIKRLQKRLAKQNKSSKRRKKVKGRIAKYHTKMANIRHDFCHQTSRALVDSTKTVFVFEDLNTKNMTKRAKPKQDNNGKYISNKAKQKSGLNRAILSKGWHHLELFTKYKAYQVGKAVFKISASYTSQECANCGHTHPDNRKSQADFNCGYCGHIDNADKNASLVIKKRAINLLLDTGTVLSARGVLTPSADKGRGAKGKSWMGSLIHAPGDEPSKKKRTIAAKVAV
jgi:putative transposase